MTARMIEVRHKVTGRKTFLAESALRHFPNYVPTPSQRARDEVPDGTAFPGGIGGPADADELDGAVEEPPRTGVGATTEAWRAYAVDVLHLEIDDDTGRDSIIARVDAANS